MQHRRTTSPSPCLGMLFFRVDRERINTGLDYFRLVQGFNGLDQIMFVFKDGLVQVQTLIQVRVSKLRLLIQAI